MRPELRTLPAGDVELEGRGPGGRPLLVGVEFKRIPDMLACVRDGRFADQLRRMKARYEVRWLLVEGEWEVGSGGALGVRERRGYRERAGHTYQEAAAWLLTMVQRGGVLVWRTRDRAESVAWLRALYWWWTSKDFEEHRAHLEWYQPAPTVEAPWADAPSMVQKVAAALISTGSAVDTGSARAVAAAAAFPTVRTMVHADEKAWRAVDLIGPKIAKRIVEATR